MMRRAPSVRALAIAVSRRALSSKTATLDALLHGSAADGGGDLRSTTGLLSAVAPMLAHTPESGARFLFTIQDELVEQEHPETAERLTTVYRELVEQGLADRARWIPASTALPADLELVHDAQLVRNSFCKNEAEWNCWNVLFLVRLVVFTSDHFFPLINTKK